MAYRIIKRSEQADGGFNGGEILEKKPIGFSQDGGIVKPYSNLFYWAHAWSEGGSTIGLHPHQGFEILSFVLTGTLEHYDTGINTWRRLETGAVQIIRSGNGISHAERLLPGASFFQIWFDPDLKKSIYVPASYDDYSPETFPWIMANGYRIKTFSVDAQPVRVTTEGVEIYELEAQGDSPVLLPVKNKITSAFVVAGKISLEHQEVVQGDFMIISHQDEWRFNPEAGTRLFIIRTPSRPSYTTYAEKYFRHQEV
ncbi:MAG: pirin family protein [Bacteroidales bacterium]|nr:pirin family protein [Bacteroidales bacterium]